MQQVLFRFVSKCRTLRQQLSKYQYFRSKQTNFTEEIQIKVIQLWIVIQKTLHYVPLQLADYSILEITQNGKNSVLQKNTKIETIWVYLYQTIKFVEKMLILLTGFIYLFILTWASDLFVCSRSVNRPFADICLTNQVLYWFRFYPVLLNGLCNQRNRL